ncbi:MAG: hypothetical protein J6J20_06085 [Muribaculaceae bacterium]|nr:hypothetical protein [Muribaculaceae bacterium]
MLADLGPGTHRRLHGLTSGKAQLRILPELAAQVFIPRNPWLVGFASSHMG